MDKKTLWALTLSFLILAVWSVIYPRLFPPPPAPPVTDQAAAGMPAGASGASGAPGAGLAGAAGAASSAAPGTAPTPVDGRAAGSIVGPGNSGASAAPKLEAPAGTPPVVVETQFARIEIASEGGSIRSWTLNQYRDGKGDPYDLVSPGSRSTGVYPLQISSGLGADYEAADVERATALASVKLGRPAASLQTQIVDEGSRGFLLWGHRPAVIHVLNVADPLEALNKARFVIERLPGSKPGSTEAVKLSYSDGAGLEATKTLEFTKDSYFVRVSADVTRLGKPVPAKIIWGPGIGTPYGDEPRRYEGAVSVGGTGAVTRMVSHYVPEPRAVAEGSMVWGGAEEQYFAAVFSPASGTMAVDALPAFPPLPPATQPASASPGASGAPPEQKIAPPKHLVVLVPTGQSYDLYAGPKDYQLLTGLGRGLSSLVDFSPSTPLIGPLIGILARLLYAGLRFLYGVVGNYGIGIVILTATVKILFYPITQRTMVKMRQVQAQMAKLKPKADAIKNKYKKIKDIAGRNKMNEEIMELYKREGVNPMASLGGCLPLLIQLPILYGFYRVLNVSIELRQAPFFGWIRDLSRSDPYYVTPIVMGASMFMQQRLAMMNNVTDPQQQMQQRMMLLMPLIFTYTFLHLPSGLVLYWFVNNVLGIAQQLLINRQAKALDAQAAAQAAGKA